MRVRIYPFLQTLHSLFLSIVLFIFLSTWLISICSAHSRKQEKLGAGDIIFLQVDSHKALNRKFQLDKDGSLVIPYIGKIGLNHIRIDQAEKMIKRKLSVFFRSLKQIKIRILQRKKYVWIKGWVKQPGRFLLHQKDGLEVLLAKAKGLRQGARIFKITVRSTNGKVVSFNLLRYYQTGSGHPPSIGRGTIVFVPVGRGQAPELGVTAKQLKSGASRIAILGAVKTPGVFPVYGAVNLLQALAMASGISSKSGWQEILITPPKGKTFFFDLKHHLGDPHAKSKLPVISAGTVIIVPFDPLGRSRKGPVHILGEVKQAGTWRGSSEKNLTSWLARSKGPTSNADLSSVSVVYKGSNFTINQFVDVKAALKEGQLERLPPTPKGNLLIFVPKKETKSKAVQDTQTLLQIAISVTSVVTSVVLLTLTLAK